MAPLNQSKMIVNQMKNKRLYQIATVARSDKRFASEIQLTAAAITATEMQFRSLVHRLVEYVYVAILIFFGRDASAISVGISQISIRHYISLEGTTQFQSLLLSMSAKENLATCCKLINTMNQNSLKQICLLYNGNSTNYYWMELQKNYEILSKLENYRGIQK